jgi:hypothetical protein
MIAERSRSFGGETILKTNLACAKMSEKFYIRTFHWDFIQHGLTFLPI